MSSPKDTEAAEIKASRDTRSMNSGEEPPIMDNDLDDDECSMPKLMEQVLSDNDDSSNDEEDFSLSQEIMSKMMEEMRILSNKHKKKKATPTKIPASPTSLTPSSGPSTPSRFLTVKQGTDEILG
eukprot:1934459-Ditylum_brightwellii.AAC.1